MTPDAINTAFAIAVGVALTVIILYTPRPPRPKGT